MIVWLPGLIAAFSLVAFTYGRRSGVRFLGFLAIIFFGPIIALAGLMALQGASWRAFMSLGFLICGPVFVCAALGLGIGVGIRRLKRLPLDGRRPLLRR